MFFSDNKRIEVTLDQYIGQKQFLATSRIFLRFKNRVFLAKIVKKKTYFRPQKPGKSNLIQNRDPQH